MATSVAYFSFQLLLLVLLIYFQKVQSQRTFEIDYKNNTFLKDGRPFRYISGSIHYSRIHPYYWKDRLLKIKAAGLNTVQTYVPWNVHELSPGKFYWDGGSDLGQFLTLAKDSDLLVLLRIGPYICGEWEFGGFPAWLLTEDPDMIFRSSDPCYIKWVDKWFTALLHKVKPFLYINGGPVIMVQVENEYGSYFACDRAYLKYLVLKVKSILGEDVTLYTTDGCGLTYLHCGKVDGAYATVDFGPGADAHRCFAAQKFYEPKGPQINSEYYTGWLDHWGHPHSKEDTTITISKKLDKLLASGANLDMYMFIGGTNFGFMNGANSPPYLPVPTSYDTGGPLTEAGDITPKYYAIRDIVSKYERLPNVSIPPNTNKTRYGKIAMALVSTIQDALHVLTPSGPIKSKYPIPMETIKIYYGFIMYRFEMTKKYSKPSLLHTKGIRDRAIIMVNAVPFGILDRDCTSLNITGRKGQFVDILVENQGRVGFSTNMNFNTKGIIGNVTLNDEVIVNWQIYPLHLENINSSSKFAADLKPSTIPKISADGKLMTPSIYMGMINIQGSYQPQDTFLDPSSWGKGQAIVNNFNIGRYWPSRGPQVTLYIPKPVFHPTSAINHIYLLELEHAPCQVEVDCSVVLTDIPNLDGPNHPGM